MINLFGKWIRSSELISSKDQLKCNFGKKQNDLIGKTRGIFSFFFSSLNGHPECVDNLWFLNYLNYLKQGLDSAFQTGGYFDVFLY